MSFELFNNSFIKKDIVTQNINKSICIDSTISNVSVSVSVSDSDVSKIKKMRCDECKCKVTITNSLECKCGQLLCMKHRMFNKHNCSIDYKTNDRKILEKNNPKIISDKIIFI